jgi:alkanesulfonate monooxygenase SsuD/methylene tetrahydromethanopterin reductase-like flavin-dependent oxidoreductase (luciferase family)
LQNASTVVEAFLRPSKGDRVMIMKYGLVLTSGDARAAADLAVDLERTGWDAIFVCEPVWGVDAWVSLTACAMVTERLRLGTMLTPPSRMRPWKLASETATLDRLSGGRVILSVGLGAPDAGFDSFGEATGRKERAELLDESLEIIDALWRHDLPLRHRGKHYDIDVPAEFPTGNAPSPVQQPRIPIWVVGLWPNERSMSRVAKYDGWIPNVPQPAGPPYRPVTADEVRDATAWLAERAPGRKHDIVVEGDSTSGDNTDFVRAMRDAGATWYIEAMWSSPDPAAVFERGRRPPPRVD